MSEHKTALEQTADQISELVAPGESLWEYPGQLYRMVESRISQLANRAEQAEALITLIEGAILDHDWQRIESAIEEYRKGEG
jgi:hypothetical protein